MCSVSVSTSRQPIDCVPPAKTLHPTHSVSGRHRGPLLAGPVAQGGGEPHHHLRPWQGHTGRKDSHPLSAHDKAIQEGRTLLLSEGQRGRSGCYAVIKDIVGLLYFVMKTEQWSGVASMKPKSCLVQQSARFLHVPTSVSFTEKSSSCHLPPQLMVSSMTALRSKCQVLRDLWLYEYVYELYLVNLSVELYWS